MFVIQKRTRGNTIIDYKLYRRVECLGNWFLDPINGTHKTLDLAKAHVCFLQDDHIIRRQIVK